MSFLEVSKLLNVFDKNQKKELYFLFFLIIISMFLEVFSSGLIVPVMMSILNQDITTLLPLTEPILNYIGSYKNKDLVIFTSLALSNILF